MSDIKVHLTFIILRICHKHFNNVVLLNLGKLPIKQGYRKTVCLPVSDKLFCKSLIGLYFQQFLCNEKNYSNV